MYWRNSQTYLHNKQMSTIPIHPTVANVAPEITSLLLAFDRCKCIYKTKQCK